MARLRIVESRLTQPLDRAKLIVYQGWNNTMARRLAAFKRYIRDGRVAATAGEVKAQHEWYREAGEPTTYALGRGATMLGFAYFARTSEGVPYQFNEIRQPELDEDGRAAFLKAVHDDLEAKRHYEGDVFTIVSEDDVRRRRLCEAIGYEAVGAGGDKLLLRKTGNASS